MPTPPLFSEFAGPNAASSPVDDIADAYLGASQGDAGTALRRAISDALFDLLEAEERARRTSRFISAGYVRGGVQAL